MREKPIYWLADEDLVAAGCNIKDIDDQLFEDIRLEIGESIDIIYSKLLDEALNIHCVERSQR
jgi:hypothetical protein